MAERSSFDEWARAASPRLFQRARLLTNDWHLAQDLLQDTLTQLFVSRRRRASSRELVSDQVPERIFVGADSATRIDLARSLSELTPAERAVIVGRYVEDLSVAEVASLVGRSETWVRQTASRTLKRMRHRPHFSPAFQE